MPKPQADESRDDFISRCIPIVLDEGTADSQDQAVAICNSMWEEEMSTTNEMIRDYVLGEFRGDFPQITINPRVNIDALTEGDENPFFVTLPVARVGEVSANGLYYDQELVTAIEQQLIGKGGIMGHIRPEERGTAFPIEDVDWVGYARVGDTTWAKGYIPPGEAREFIRRLMARGGSLATSIYGPYTRPEERKDGSIKIRDFKLESLDLAPADRAALSLGGEFAVTAQMTTETNQEGEQMDKKELLAELTAKDIPDTIREQIVTEWQEKQGTQSRIAELEQERDDALGVIGTLQAQIDQYTAREFDAALDAKVAELVNWKVKGEEAQGKVDALRRMVRSRIVSELGDNGADKLGEAAETVWTEMNPIAETIRDALAGPAAIVSGRVNGTSKLEDTPEARRAARAKVGI